MRLGTILLVALGALLLAGSAAASPAATVTAMVGDGSAGGQGMSQMSEVVEGQPVETAEDANCSMLLDENALLELCGNTVMRLEREDPQGPRIVRVDSGEARVSAPELAGASRIEIHTPTAVATLLGTSLHVSVDINTGDTTFSCLDNPVNVASNSVGGDVNCANGQQVFVPANQAPQERGALTAEALKGLDGCLIDFHAVALATDRAVSSARAVTSLTNNDILPEIPGVGEGPFDPVLPEPGDNLVDPDNTVEDQVQSGDDIDMPSDSVGIINPPGPGGGGGGGGVGIINP